MEKMRTGETTKNIRVIYPDDHRSSYHMMLNSITNDLDLLLSEFCQLSYQEPGVHATVAGHSRPRRVHGKKPMQFENCSAFGGSSTSGTLTSTDSNHSNKDVQSGTLTSTDSNRSHPAARQPACVDVVGVALTRALEQPPCPEKQPSPSRSTSGSDLRQITVLERLTKTHPIWFLPTVARSGAVHLLKDRETGIFIVRKSSREEIMALSVQFPTEDGIPNVDHYLIEPGNQGLHLQGSGKQFSAIPNLVAHYCDNKEDLPHRLVLPNAIRTAKTSQELAGLAMLGQDFWTTVKFEGQSRSSSKSNLSDQSSTMNKSMSEPISISKAPVTAYSQSEPLIQNTPPKHSVIDFQSYLIKPKETLEVRKCTRSVSVNESVHMKCSVHERKPCNHLSMSHVTDHVTQCESCLQEQESCEKDLLLHWELQQTAASQMRRQDSQVSVPYAKPDKSKTGTGQAGVCFETPLDLLNIPEDYYFRSNLSDKLSDYEDIWKNNYSESNVGCVQADIVQRLQPNLVTFNNNNNNNMITNDINRTSSEMAHNSCASMSMTESTSFNQEQVHVSETCVKESNISVIESHTSVQNVSSFSSKSIISNQNETDTVTAVSENHVMHDSIDGKEEEEEGGVVNNLSELKLDKKTEKALVSDVNCNFMLSPVEENDSDTDTEGCHSNSCHSDDDGEADTEDVDDSPNITSVQTQTSPVWKTSVPPPGCVARKSVSTTMLTAMKSPVYSEPFDAISREGQQLDQVPKLPKKMRRRSAPAVTSSRKRLGLSEQARLSPVVSSHVEDVSTAECECGALDEVDGPVQNLAGDNDEVFQISPDMCVEHAAQENRQIDKKEETYEKAWESEKVSVKKPSLLNHKPAPNPRKSKYSEKFERDALNRESSPPLVHNGVDMARARHTSTGHPVFSQASNVLDQIHILENFSTDQAPSSPTLCKFPVYNRHVSEDSKNMFSEGSTAEDMICTWNPELTLKPLKPFPVLGDPSAMSEYDNLNNPSYISPSVASAGTVFCNPWEHSVVGKIINTHTQPLTVPHKLTKSKPPSSAPPPLPPPMDPRERIKAWQESSQKYHSVTIGTEEDHRFSIISDEHSVDAVTFGGELSSSYDFKVSSNGKSPSDKTLVNEKSSQSGTPGAKAVGNFLLYGADFREKVAPILANPPLLNKPDRSRNPDRKIRDYIIALSKDHETTFGSTIENFIQCTQESQDQNPFNITRNVRQFMNGIKNYLVKHGEGELEDLIERERSKLGKDEILNIDAIIEGALHVCVIQPLKQNIYRLFVNEYTKNGNLKLLSSNIKYARTKTAEEIGIRKGLSVPTGPTLEMIKHYFTRMQKSYSPLKKLENLLGATSAIYRCVTTSKQKAGNSFGADDFLPMLIYVLIQCGLVSVEIEADYMWGLLHPSLLTGEGGYYLTSLSSAVLVLKNFRHMQETSASQHQGKMPSISDMQGFIRIAIPDEHRDTIVWKTLPVRPSMTTKDVCSLIAHKFKITNPQDYGLYTLESGEECKMMDMECPQGLKVERLSRNKECIFAYKRNAANIAWPKSVQ